MQEAGVRSLVGELRAHLLRVWPKKETINDNKYHHFTN